VAHFSITLLPQPTGIVIMQVTLAVNFQRLQV